MAKKMRLQKTGKIKEKRKAKRKFNLKFEIPGKFSSKNSGQETCLKIRNKMRMRSMQKIKINGKS
jgi:hypothetical protein